MLIGIILEQCLEAIHCENATAADCLAKYPEYADELAPLLEMAMAIEELPDIKPSDDFREATRERLLHLPGPTSDGKAGEQAAPGSVTFNDESESDPRQKRTRAPGRRSTKWNA